MIGIWKSYSNIYLYVVGAAMLVAFGIPLLTIPLQWAGAFGWEIPQTENLVVFLGRSLGVMISVLSIFAFKAARSPSAKPFFFELLLWMLAAMMALHIFGAIKATQPITETVEILLWIVLFLITLCFYPILKASEQ
jgi:hypothetical protein